MCTETYTDQLFIHHRCQALAHRLEEEMVTLVTLSLYLLNHLPTYELKANAYDPPRGGKLLSHSNDLPP